MAINDDPITLLDDNKGSLALTKNPEHHQRTKHIDIKYHYIRQLIEDNNVTIDYIPTDKIATDILTKPLTMKVFQKDRRLLRIYDYSSKYTRSTPKRIQR